MSDKKSDSGSKSTLEIILEFGHKAILKDKTVNDYTHDWEIWVKNPNDGKIENFLEKAVFTLHPTFDNNIRTVTRAPFRIADQAYGTFPIKIDLYFKVIINHSVLRKQLKHKSQSGFCKNGNVS